MVNYQSELSEGKVQWKDLGSQGMTEEESNKKDT